MGITCIVLAAGLGKRMKSSLPKVLHCAAGRTLIDHVMDSLDGLNPREIRVVVGHGADAVTNHLKNRNAVNFYFQSSPMGTADAVRSANPENTSDTIIICGGDTPLVRTQELQSALDIFQKEKCDLLMITVSTKNNFGLGRVLRDKKGTLIGVVEEKDATSAQKKIREINSGIYIVKANLLKETLPLIEPKNQQGEYYLTDVIKHSVKLKKKIVGWDCKTPSISFGVNTKWELAKATKKLHLRKAKTLAEAGVEIIDPGNCYIDMPTEIGVGSSVGPGCVISNCQIGENVKIEGHCYLQNSRISSGAHIRWGTVVESSEIQDGAVVGPYARIRPESTVGKQAHVGNFVELKKVQLGDRAKANHLTYLGDAEIGEDTNIGCGTITCNYAIDRKKYKTKIGKNVFVGSDTQFVAPINIGDGAVIGSGSTITKDVPENALAIARGKQWIKENFNKE